HQTGPAGAVLFAPPFRDPFNYNFDPLVVLGIDMVGSAIHTRFAAEGKPGAVMRTGAPYSTWFNGGIRTTSYFHNQIGILTETIGNPTPVEIPFVLDMQRPRADGRVHQRAARSEAARSARVHSAVGSARLPDRDEVRQHPDQGGRRGASRDGAVHRRRHAVSRGLVRGEGGAAVPRARDGH